MAFDGGFLHKTVAELNTAADCHIEKIYQPSKDELVILLRKKGFARRLIISAKQGAARIHFTEGKYENPATPPNFCMLLRKYITAARFVSVTQPGLERIAEIHLSATNELGDIVGFRLVCELISANANIILVNSDGKIVDALRHSDVETAKRLILPGAKYEYPDSQKKLIANDCDMTSAINKVNSFDSVFSGLISTFEGFSPLICREIEHLSANSGLENAVTTVSDRIYGDGGVFMLTDSDGVPFEFTYTTITQYGDKYKSVHFDSCSELLDSFYSARENADRIRIAAHDILGLVKNLKARTEKRLNIRQKELSQSADREHLRIYGELIKANLHSIAVGSNFAEVTDYYDPELKVIKIPLNPALSPAKNADKYFKDYKKSYTAEQTLRRLTLEDGEELLYLDTVLDSIMRASTVSEIAEIRLELENAGYIKNRSQKKKNPATPSLKETVSKEGYKIVIGKNNIQNDYITTKLATKFDLWFHVKNIPGSHVVVFCGQNPVSDDTVLQAAKLAAANSKAATSSNVPVDYTPVKYVKKPAGAKPGMVIYTTNKTVFVTPED